jgi:hypothetical protein
MCGGAPVREVPCRGPHDLSPPSALLRNRPPLKNPTNHPIIRRDNDNGANRRPGDNDAIDALATSMAGSTEKHISMLRRQNWLSICDRVDSPASIPT